MLLVHPRIGFSICRQYFPRFTKGVLTTPTGFTCGTLELPWKDNAPNLSCIPEGVYKVVPRQSAKYGHHLHVTGVDGRSLILIHWGNYAASANPRTGTPDIRGCILVGYGYADLDGDGYPEITRSRDAFNALMKAHPDGFELTVHGHNEFDKGKACPCFDARKEFEKI